MIVTLDVVDGPERGKSFHFSELDSFLVGRSLKAHLRLDPVADPFISRTHCLIEVRPPRCILTDLGSTNGTKVNDQPVRIAELGDTDLIRVGHTAIRIVVEQTRADNKSDEKNEAGPGDDEPGDAEPGDAERSSEERNDFATAAINLKEVGIPQGPTKVLQLDSKSRVAASRGARCHDCGCDVSARAYHDEMASTYQAVEYLCAVCMRQSIETLDENAELGVYTLLKEVGRGGMGVVYKAAHKVSGRVCAIKQLLPESARDENARRLFEREIDVQTRVEHPHLVRVFHRARDDDETLYFVTEYMPGGDLERYASKIARGPVAPRIACKMICQILSGLEELHSRGMIHRDLKPSNFLLSTEVDDPACLAKICDYGLAKCFEEAGNSVFAYTDVGHVAGSMLFMAPEQITNFRFVRPPADVYSVGVSLYYLLTATYTVDFLAPQATGRKRHPVEMIVEDPPVPILERGKTLPVQLAEVVDKAVRKTPERRYQTAFDFLLALERVMAELNWSG